MGWAGSVLDPTQTRPASVGWRNPKSIAGINRLSWLRVRVSVGQFGQSLGTKKSHRNLQKTSSESGNIFRNLEKVAKCGKNRWNLQIFFFSLKIAKIWSNLAKSHQVQLDIIEISPDLVEISPNLACFCKFGLIFYMALVGFVLLGFWRRKLAPRLAGVGS